MSDYESLSQSDIDKILHSLETGELPKEITTIKPKEIEQESDPVTKENLRRQFNQIKTIYVTPLQELWKYQYMQMHQESYSLDLSENSILESMATLGKYLQELGYNYDQLAALVPKTASQYSSTVNASQDTINSGSLSSSKNVASISESKGPKL